jgi:hypothetical protein
MTKPLLVKNEQLMNERFSKGWVWDLALKGILYKETVS